MKLRFVVILVITIIAFLLCSAFAWPPMGFEHELGHYWGQASIGNGEYISSSTDREAFTFRIIDTLGERDKFRLADNNELTVYRVLITSMSDSCSLRIVIDERHLQGWTVYNEYSFHKSSIKYNTVKMTKKQIKEIVPKLEATFSQSLMEDKSMVGSDGWHVTVQQAKQGKMISYYVFAPLARTNPLVCAFLNQCAQFAPVQSRFFDFYSDNGFPMSK
jgi:hypothetical protein